MQYIKLQLGCLIMILFPLIRNTRMARILGVKRSNEIIKLQAAVVSELFFDAATAYTVNKLDSIPGIVNGILHWGFLVSISSLVFFFFSYFMSSLQNHEWEKRKKSFTYGIYILDIILITATMPWIYYVIGKTTNYSYGIPVYITYAMLFAMLTLLTIELIKVWREISMYQKSTAMVLYITFAAVTILQVIFPEILISSLVPVMVLYAASMNIEDPRLIHLYAEQERIRKELERINALLSSKERQSQRTGEPAANAELIVLSGTTHNEVRLLPDDLLYAEAEGNYVTVVYQENNEIKRQQIRQTMKQVMQMTEDNRQIIRVHRAYIVNLNHVVKVSGNSQGYQLSLDAANAQVPVSRSFVTEFNEAFSC